MVLHCITTIFVLYASFMEQHQPNQDLKISDIRMLRPFAIFEKKSSTSIICQQNENFEIKKCKVTFYTPNTVSLFLSISNKELIRATEAYKLLFDKKLNPDPKVIYSIPEQELPKVYDYLEFIQTSIISMYSAVEAFANIAIPNEHLEEKINNKGIKEVWDKIAIERWYSTSEKIGDLLPKILNIESPKTLSFWSNFKKLEQLRNDIIHPKISPSKINEIESSFLEKLFQEDIFALIKCGYQLIKYYCEKNESHSYYPIGLGKTIVQPIEVDDFSDHIDIEHSE